MRNRSRRGLTLIEVLMATVLTGVSVLGALGMLNQAQAVSGQLQRTSTTSRRSQAPLALLRSFTQQLSVATDTSTSFEGSETGAWFQSRCRVPRGWIEKCSVALDVEDSGGVSHLRLTANGLGRWDVVTDSSLLELRYLEDASNGGRWRTLWHQTRAVPLGIGVIVHRDGMTDTLFFRIGPRE